SVGVFIGASFPTMMRIGEVKLHSALFFDLAVAVELGAVVRRDGFDSLTMPAQQLQGASGRFGAGARFEFAQEHVAAFAFDQREQAVFSPAHHRVDLPVAEPGALLHGSGSFADVPLASKPSTVVIA